MESKFKIISVKLINSNCYDLDIKIRIVQFVGVI